MFWDHFLVRFINSSKYPSNSCKQGQKKTNQRKILKMFSNYFIQDALCQNLVYEISFEQQEIFEIISKIFFDPNFTRSKTTQYNINYTVLHLILILFCAKICCFAAILFLENFLATPLQIVLSKFVFFLLGFPQSYVFVHSIQFVVYKSFRNPT